MQKFFIFFMLGMLSIAYGQTTVNLQIHHKLDGSDFAFNTNTANNLGNNFYYTRAQYYISEISIIHDGGIETPIPDLYILADASETIQVALGSFDITYAEALRMHIGVDSLHNHSDPATYAHSHPLALQNPSMHWGWTAGYRFSALEGFSGAAQDQNFQIHSLGDINYMSTEIVLDKSAVNNGLTISIDADMSRAMQNINLENGIILHSENDEAQVVLSNFKFFVFTASADTVSGIAENRIKQIGIFPNPSADGRFQYFIQSKKDAVLSINLLDVQGKLTQKISEVKNNSFQTLELPHPGLYLLQISQQGRTVAAKNILYTQ